VTALRSIPKLVTIRPADANEVTEAWRIAVENRHQPTALILTRQNLPILDRAVYTPASGLRKGAYVLADLGEGSPQLILMASGSEVALIVQAGQKLASEGIAVRLVSFPSWELFDAQDRSYQETVLPPEVDLRLAVDAGISLGWHRWVGIRGRILALDQFGASGPAKQVFEHFGLTAGHVEQMAVDLLGIKQA
jgi:transketolase